MSEDKPEKRLDNMSYMELLEEARKIGIKNASQYSKRELLFELGGSPEGTVVYDRRLYHDPEDIRMAADKNKQVPGRTIYSEEQAEAVEKILAQNPDAFNDYDLTDKRNNTKYIFKRPKMVGRVVKDENTITKKKIYKNYAMVECFCGAEIPMHFIDDDVDTARAVCGCGKQVIFIDPDRELKVAK